MSKARLDGLDGLRGIAALCVFLSHVFADIPGNAYLAVDFFFMLSGYVMARSYEGRLREKGQVGAFLRARVARLYPLVALGSLIGIPWLFAEVGTGAWPLVIAGLLLLPCDGPSGPYMLNPPAWSIACELGANLLHALLFARLGTRGILLLCVVLLALLLLATRGEGLALVPSSGNRVIAMMRTMLPYLMGVVMFRTWRDTPPIHVSGAVTWAAMPLFFAAGAILGLERSPLDFFFVLLVCPVLIAGGLRNGAGAPLARAAGAVSFPLYAVHGPVVLTLKSLGVPPIWQVALGLAAGAATLWLSRAAAFVFGQRRPMPVAAP